VTRYLFRNATAVLAMVVTASLAASAAPPPASPEKRQWERTASGSFLLPSGGRLKILTQGTVSVRGTSAQTVTYTLRQKVRARSQAEADRLFRRFSVLTTRQGGWTVFTANHGRGDDVEADLVVSVPRNIRASFCRTVAGGVAASDLDGPFEVEAAGPIDVDRLGSDLQARTAGGEIRVGRVRGKARLSSSAGPIVVGQVMGEAWVQTAGGEIVVNEAGAAIHAVTNGGGVRVARAAANVTARTAGGRIEVDRAAGWVFAENTAGPIQVGSARGVQCEAGSGAIRLREVYGALRAATARGNIMAEIAAGRGLEDSFLNTADGDVTVLLPSNLAVLIQAQNEAGNVPRRIVSEFPEIQVRTLQLRPVQAVGALNGGGPVLRISAAGGTIYLRRQK
jgi:hypothetical protein